MLPHVKIACLVPILMLGACLTDEDADSLARELGGGVLEIDQEQQYRVWSDGCAPDTTGGLAQGVTPAASSWRVVTLFLSTTEEDDQLVQLEIRAGAPDGPTIASATRSVRATVPYSIQQVDYVFFPSVELTPGSPVYLYAGVDDRVDWPGHWDAYSGGDAYSLCSDQSGPQPLDGNEEGLDFSFITYTTPDSDGDGIEDDRDPDIIAAAIELLPDSAFAAPGHRSAITAQLAAAEAAILAGDIEQARRILQRLRLHVDGCEAGPSADHDDWVTECADQDPIRDLIDGHLAAL